MPEIFVFCTFFIAPVKSDSQGEMVHEAPLSNISNTSSGVIEYFVWLVFSSERYTNSFWFSSSVRAI